MEFRGGGATRKTAPACDLTISHSELDSESINSARNRLRLGGRSDKGCRTPRIPSRHSDGSQSLSMPIETASGSVAGMTNRSAKSSRKAAFTMAEVLITLGIIGIIAAMTLPSLIGNYQKKVVAKRLEQTYSQIYQAINMAQIDYGDMRNWETNKNYNSNVEGGSEERALIVEQFVETYMKPYFNYLNKPGTYYLKNIGYSGYKTKDGRFYLGKTIEIYVMELNNGVSLLFLYNGQGDQMTYPIIYVDVTGKSGPNVVGRDFFMFQLDSIHTMKVLPAGYGKKREELLKLCGKNAGGKTYDNLSCTGLIMTDGWEIKDDYPW